MPRQKGLPKTGGRRPGSSNKNTPEVQLECQKLVADKDYRKSFKTRLEGGTLPAPLEAMVWHYAHGKPAEHLEVGGEGGGPVRVEYVIVGG